MSSANIARHLPLMAASAPDRPAVKVPRGRTGAGIDYLTLSFAELDAEVDAWMGRFAAASLSSGDRALVMVRQGLPLIASVFALFKYGAVPVIIDPGMGLKSFLACVARTRPKALVGIPLAQLVSRFAWRSFRSVDTRIWVSGSPTARLLAPGARYAGDRIPLHASAPRDLAAVLFTSGSTGAPKGVCYDHGMFDAQVRLVRSAYAIRPGEIDLPMLPIFALFNPALGMTTIVPELDPSRPAAVDPARIVDAIRQEGVTNSFGSPTLWRKIAAHCRARQLTLPSLRRVLMAGAPVPVQLFEDVQAILPNGTAHSPYGATEALPVASVSADEVLGKLVPAGNAAPGALLPAVATAAGAGTLVGRPVPEVQIRIIPITDGPVESLETTRPLPAGEIGEIVVCGPAVTREYADLPDATRLAKIVDPLQADRPASPDCPPGVWHRMGDVGYLDAHGRLWFCGRKAERVETDEGPLFTEQVEPIFNAHRDVRRSALVGLGEPGRQRPAIIVEPRGPAAVATPSLRRKLVRELRVLAAAHAHTEQIRLMYLHPAFPVDVRHNAKIHRLALARWAAARAGYELDRREVPREVLRQ
ncbi:MAG TPA: fatty acid CoA ligase family protein [Opitutaceae bacterium]|nr:fatty acid CoA ligase family protein [Opitutaceae bacterium]